MLNAFPSIPMAGQWKFQEGDNTAWSAAELDLTGWKSWNAPREWPIGRVAGKTGCSLPPFSICRMLENV